MSFMTDKECFARIITPASFFTVTISLYGKRLALMGSFRGCNGQISGELRKLIDTEPNRLAFSMEDAKKLCDVWDRWHLNDMRAGTKKQEDAIRELRRTRHIGYKYEEACEYLDEIGLLVDEGYKFGSSWLTEEVPQDVLRWLFSLPGEGNTFDEIYSPEISEQEFIAALLV